MPDIPGTPGDDTLTGTSGDDTINGFGGNDTINGGDGNDTIDGGDGDDILDGGLGQNNVSGGAGDDLFRMSVVSSGLADSTLNGGAGFDTLDFSVAGSFLFFNIEQTSPDTVLVGDNIVQNVERFIGGSGGDIFGFTYAASGLEAHGGGGNDSFSGGAGADVFYGGIGADSFNSVSGGDRAYGEDGDDFFFVSGVFGASASPGIVSGGNGRDTLALNISFTVDLAAGTAVSGNANYAVSGFEVIIASITGGYSSTILGSNADEDIQVRMSTNDANSSATFEGRGGNDVLRGGNGNDVLRGGDGDDILIGRLGRDILNGDAGNDIIRVNADAVIDGGSGHDDVELLFGDRTSALDVNFANFWTGGTVTIGTGSLTGVERIIALVGTAHNDRVTTGDASTSSLYFAQINGGGGDDELTGGANAISLIGDDGNDVLRAGSGATALIGGAGNDQAFGGSGADSFDGGTGDDTVHGGDGNDSLNGGVGFDILNGGAGNDRIFSIDAGAIDQLNGNEGDDFFVVRTFAHIDGGAGRDVLNILFDNSAQGVNFDLSGLWTNGTSNFGGGSITGVEHINELVGSAFADTLILGGNTQGTVTLSSVRAGAGNDEVTLGIVQAQVFGEAGDDVLRSGQGFASLFGGDGNDRLVSGSGGANIQGGAGDDLVEGGDGRDSIDDDQGNNTLRGGANNDFVRGSGALYGDEGDDYLVSTSGSGSLFGGDGIDRLEASGARDFLYGGAGNDIYNVDNIDHLIFEDADGGSADQVYSAVSFYLYANVEHLDLSGATGNVFGVGNELANVLGGNGGDNLLIGWGGNDILSGQAGRDALFGVDGNDTIGGGAGIDYIVGGAGNDDLRGEADADEIYGQEGDDVIDGGTSFDTDIMVGGTGNDIFFGNSGLGDYDLMYGNEGDDQFYVDTPADLVFEQVGEGVDTVFANITGAGYYLYDNIENLVLFGETPFGVGNASNNSITGNDVGNYLLGGAGDDRLNGRGGDDVLFGQAGSDTFIFANGGIRDVIGDFEVGIDKIDLSALGIASFAQLQSMFVQDGATGAIRLNSNNVIILHNVTMSTLTASDFIFGGP